jgi:hypothetical protein
MTTTGFDESIFPYVFECTDCPHGSTVEITYDEAVGELPFGLEPADTTPRRAVNNALVSRGWWDKGTGWICPKCVEDLE